MRIATSRRSGSIALDDVDAGEVQRAGLQRRREAPGGRRPCAAEGRNGGLLATHALGGVTVVDFPVRSSHEGAVHLFIGWYLRSRALSTDSVADLHSMGKVNTSAEGKESVQAMGRLRKVLT